MTDRTQTAAHPGIELDVADHLLDKADALLRRHRDGAPTEGAGHHDDLPVLTDVVFDDQPHPPASVPVRPPPAAPLRPATSPAAAEITPRHPSPAPATPPAQACTQAAPLPDATQGWSLNAPPPSPGAFAGTASASNHPPLSSLRRQRFSP
ncbi:hypothetical protein AGMMS49960_00990 [Betaproteobacteria bacterium]|nr:hypothetical protein AGMMS49960_00990 [Betaproteobacteria bacterium]